MLAYWLMEKFQSLGELIGSSREFESMSVHPGRGPSEALSVSMSPLISWLLAAFLTLLRGRSVVVAGIGSTVICHPLLWLSDRSCTLCGAR